ncbi:hypothetical protein D9M71_487180 [compost metagenome]
MLGARREHQQQLGIGGHRLGTGLEQQLADAFGQRRTARLAGQQHFAAGTLEAFGQIVAIGTLAGAFGAFEGDEQTTHGVFPCGAAAGLDR